MTRHPGHPLLQAIPPELGFYVTRPHPCSYLVEREATTMFVDPAAPMSTSLYSALAEFGFRRSGGHVYRPSCSQCNACLPARVPVHLFKLDRSQRRAWQRNRDLTAHPVRSVYREEHFRLYERYIAARHAGGGMDVQEPEQYREFLTSSWCDTWFVEFHAGGRLVAVSVMDRLLQGLSAVYTFYDPSEEKRSLGVFAVMWLVEEARRLHLPWVYLGYLIRECPKMAYKERYRPLEIFSAGRWQRTSPHAPRETGGL